VEFKRQESPSTCGVKVLVLVSSGPIF